MRVRRRDLPQPARSKFVNGRQDKSVELSEEFRLQEESSIWYGQEGIRCSGWRWDQKAGGADERPIPRDPRSCTGDRGLYLVPN